MRCLSGIRLEKVPDETTILNCRHLLEHLAEAALMLKEGTIQQMAASWRHRPQGGTAVEHVIPRWGRAGRGSSGAAA